MKSDYILVTDSVSQRPYYRRRPQRSGKSNPVDNGAVTCKDCGRYPCFTGIDGMASNLAVTCHDFELARKPLNP